MTLDEAISSVSSTVVVDLAKITSLVESILSAAPVIESGAASITIFVEAIASMIKAGGTPTDDQWASLKASLDLGSAALQEAADDAAKEIQKAAENSKK